jgi:hypothetical protein
VYAPAPAPSLPDFLDGWSFAPALEEDSVSYGVSSKKTDEAVPTWRIDLPPGESAHAVLNAAEERLHQSEIVLQSIPDQLDALLLAASTGMASYSTPASGASVELLDLLEQAGDPGTTSFSLFAGKRAQLTEASQEFQNILGRLSSLVSSMASVETRLDGRLLARTRVTWNGSFDSHVAMQLASSDLRLHRRSINLALGSRRLAVSLIARTAQGAVKISTLLAAPGGVVLALPAVWKYIQSVLSDIQKYQELKS